MTDLLWDPIDVGQLRPAHRLAMAPMTRSRSAREGVPGEHNAEFFLASPDADFVTGQTLNVDGGKFMP